MGTTKKKSGFDLTKLSQISKAALNKPTQAAETELDLGLIDTKPQVRKTIRKLDELAESIKMNGIIEPLVVHAEANGRYRLIIGERRFRAAPMANLTKVPVIIKRGLDELQIRALQVAENNDRDDLTPFDEAQGVIEDVDNYGAKEAQKIWNRSEGWISKRVATKRYEAPVLELLQSEICGDFEVLHCLNQIYLLEENHTEFSRMRTRLSEGLPLSRDEARNLVTRVKAHKQNQEDFSQRREQLRKNELALSENESIDFPQHTVSDQAPKAGDVAEPTLASHVSQPATSPELVQPQQKIDKYRRQLVAIYSDTLALGEKHRAHINNMKRHMTSLNFEFKDTEFFLWQSFCATLIPMLDGIGPERAGAYLKKILSEMKGKTPAELMEAFPLINPEAEPFPNTPEDWHL